MPVRGLQPLPVLPGAKVLEILPALERALHGDGPALLPVPASSPEEARGVCAALGGGEPLEAGEDAPGDPTALVIATSGSTGVPKGVLLSASALRSSATATHRHLGGPGHWLLALPPYHIAGIQVLVRSLIAGNPPRAVDTSDGFRPDRFAEAAREMFAANGPHYTALVPTQLARLLDDGGKGLETLREFDSVLLGGAATPPALSHRAGEAGVRVVTTYGMSETSGGCIYDGIPLDGVNVHIDPSNVIMLAGPMLARGYRRMPNAESFAGGWFRTGDLGSLRDGKVEILGRTDDVIITGGVKVAPLPVERVLAEHRGVRDACVLGIEDPEWGQVVVAAVVPVDHASPPSADELRSAVRERLNAASTPKRVVFLDELPLRGPGKPDRRALEAQLGPDL